MVSALDILGLATILVGIALFVWRNKRAFARTNSAGIEQFSSYGQKIAARFWDVFLWVLGFGCIALGVVILAIENQSSWGWAVFLGCLMFMLFGFPFGRSK